MPRPAVDLPLPLLHLVGAPAEGNGAMFPIVAPADGETLAMARGADGAQVDAALAAARAEADHGTWRETPATARATILREVATRLEADRDHLATLVAIDNGKTIGEAHGDVIAAVAAFRAAADAAVDPMEEALPDRGGVRRIVRREPVGLVAAITPYNAPLAFTALKMAPALAAGNAIVLKPSERAPLLPRLVCDAAHAAGVPPGTVALLHGGPDIAAQLSSDPRVDMVTLTGGVDAGRAVMRAAADTFKRLVLELGGKSAHIVLADADLDQAVPAVAAGIFKNAGQRCLSGSRLVVEHSVADEVEARLVATAAALRVGDPFDPTTQIGAMIDDRAIEATERFVERARHDGLRVVAGGHRVAELAPGSFFRPTVLVGARSGDFAAQEELFGPVLTVIRVADAAEAVAVANHSRFGLTGGVWTADPERGLEIARRIRTGYFWVNTFAAIYGDLPFGGVKLSGLGREAGRAGFDAYTELKSLIVDTTGGTSALRFT